MNIKLEEHIRGSRVRLIVDDAPMTAMRSLVAAFVTACDTVEEHWEPFVAVDTASGPDRAVVTVMKDGEVISIEEVERLCGNDHTPNAETTAAMEEVTQKRKRRTKAEMLAAAQQDALQEAARQQENAPATAAEVQEAVEVEQSVEAVTSLTTEPEDVPLPFDAGSAEAEQPATAEEPSDAPTPADTDTVTDTELQRFCGRLAQHFGGAQKVFDLSTAFVGEGEVARPTNIKDNAQRWAFIRHAEKESGLVYHG